MVNQKKVIIRQGLVVSSVELRKLANQLAGESKEFMNKFGIKIKDEMRYIVPIINKTGMSDDWEFEHE